MDEIKIKDLKFDGKGIFYYINEVKPFNFNEVLDVHFLDVGFEMRHGEKPVTRFVLSRIEGEITAELMTEIAEVLVYMYGEKWETIISMYLNDIDLDTYNMTTTESIDETSNRSNTREDLTESERENLTSAYNVEDFSNEGKEIQTGSLNVTDTGTGESVKQVTRNVKGSMSNKLKDIRYIRGLLHTNVLNDIIYLDVSQMIGVLIY